MIDRVTEWYEPYMQANSLMTCPLVLALTLGACTSDAPADGDDSSESGSETAGDGDHGDGDQGDGDQGDGDGDQGDGDGDQGDGDGDGDPSCECPDGGNYDQCSVEEDPLLLLSTFTWPPNTSELELDEICTVASIGAGVAVTLDCPAGQVEITLEIEPAWVPAFTTGEQVHLRASESLGMAQGDSWQHLRWRIDRADDSQMLANYIDSGDSTPNLIGDPYTIEVVSGVCEPECLEGKSQAVGVRFTADGEEVLLFAGQSGELGEQEIRVRTADLHTCTDLDPGRYTMLVTPTDAANDACALVLDQSYSSQEQLECGLGPNGVALCNWTVGFDGSQYTWSHSDVGEGGDYSCAGLDLLNVPEGEVIGSVSPDGAVLTWYGVAYDRD